MNKTISLLPGERILKEAPRIRLGNGTDCVPQHYLQFSHTLETVESVLLDIEFNNRYPVFACMEYGGLYIQVGIIGFDNYLSHNKRQKEKLVYGRKWRIEPALPTSEIIQTVFLALQKAREHEVRELFSVMRDGYRSTPFNNHHDLPLMSQHAGLFRQQNESSEYPLGRDKITLGMNAIFYDHARFELVNIEHRYERQWLLDLKVITDPKTRLPEIQQAIITLVLEHLTMDEIYYALMSHLVAMSHRYVEEHFRYKKFARFSRENSVIAIGKLSSTLRQRESRNVADSFSTQLQSANYTLDQTRVPSLSDSQLSQKIIKELRQYPDLEGILPY